MSSVKERVSYLNGLVEGLGIAGDTKEGKAILEISKVLHHIAEKLEDLEEAQYDIEEYLEAMDDDLTDVEDDMYGDDDVDECYDEYDEDYDDDFIDVLCPHCNETVYIDKAVFDNKNGVRCPNCHTDVVTQCPECSDEYND